MIELTSGDLLTANVEALVNPVSCPGVMGNGLALQFKRAFPENYRRYRLECDGGTLGPGEMIVTPTKRHFRDASRVEDIEAGLIALMRVIRDLGITSVTVPALGCGFGGLSWEDYDPR
jgi:O-acetyl-ADP-ribose deacetylase (regulator of RNase III)